MGVGGNARAGGQSRRQRRRISARHDRRPCYAMMRAMPWTRPHRRLAFAPLPLASVFSSRAGRSEFVVWDSDDLSSPGSGKRKFPARTNAHWWISGPGETFNNFPARTDPEPRRISPSEIEIPETLPARSQHSNTVLSKGSESGDSEWVTASLSGSSKDRKGSRLRP